MTSLDNLSHSDTEIVEEYISALPLPETATAYELAWRCYEDFQNRDKPLPSWTHIRALIGKGSANDINRAKQDFVETQLRIAKQSRLGGEELPERLKPLFQQFWQSAIDQAESNMATRFTEMESRIELALAKEQQFASENSTLLERLKTTESERLVLEHALQDVLVQLNSERLAKEGIEQKLTSYIADLAQQKEDLLAALNTSNEEVKKSLDRLEAMEDRTLLEIDKVKTDFTKELSSKDANLRSLNAEYTIAIAKEKQRADHLIAECNGHKESVIELETENKALREKLYEQSVLYERLHDLFKGQQSSLTLLATQHNNVKKKVNRKEVK